MINLLHFDDLSSINNRQILIDVLSTYQYDLSFCLTNCSNNGQCVLDSATSKYFCMCLPNFIGIGCQTTTSPCSKYPCLNNSTCNDLNETSFKCECRENFYGKFCENRINLCQNITCSSNGYCFLNESVTLCKCYINYYGVSCEYEREFVKIIKTVTSVSLVAFLICISFFALSIIGNDIWSCLIRNQKNVSQNVNKKHKLVRLKYYS